MHRTQKSYRIFTFLLVAILLMAVAYLPGLVIPILMIAAVIYGLFRLLIITRTQERGELRPQSHWPVWMFIGIGLAQLWLAWQPAMGEASTTHKRGLGKLIDLGVEHLGALPIASLEALLGAACLYTAWWICRRI